MSLNEDAAYTIVDGKNIYGKDVALEETVEDADEQTVTEQAQSDESLPADDSAADAVNREQLERILGSKASYTSENAVVLYEELRNLKKGVRASNQKGRNNLLAFIRNTGKAALYRTQQNKNFVAFAERLCYNLVYRLVPDRHIAYKRLKRRSE